MDSKKYLAKNIGLLTISQFGTKILSFFLVPLYTYILTTSEYGTYDLYNTTVSLLVPVLTLNIADPVLRFTLDKDSNKKSIFSIAIKYFLMSCIIFALLIVFNLNATIYSLLNQYTFYLICLFAITALNGILVNFCRGVDRVKELAFSGILCSLVIIFLNIIFLAFLHLGLSGYFLANIIGILVQCIYIFITAKCWNYISLFEKDKPLESDMVKYSKPLLINNISWWVSSASDRYVVIWLCGIAANGIYSVGYKIPSILNMFQTVFSQAWTLSAVKDFDPDDKNGFFAGMYNSYNFCMTFVCACLIAMARIMARILYAKDFYEAWKYVPFLLIAIVFGALSGYVGGIFAAVKDSKIFAQSSITGALVNIALNIILVKQIGALGAAVATMICYVLIWILRIVAVKKYIFMDLNLMRDILAYIVLLCQTVLLFIYPDSLWLYLFQATAIILILILFKKESRALIDLIQRKTRILKWKK